MIEHLDFTANFDNQCRRLFHGRGHAYPGYHHLNVDWLPPVVVITLYQEERLESLQAWAGQLIEQIPQCRSVQVQHRYRHGGPFELLGGEDLDRTEVDEDGLKFHIQLGASQNTGLFLDMREGRRWVREHAHGKRVLNLFAYTCAFSVAALAGGATTVVNVDNNKGVLSRGRENHRLNGQDLGRVRFEGVNVFTSWSRIRKHAPYDLLVCDPPTFQKGSVDIERDYKKIIARLPQFMQTGSELMLCLNAPDLSADFLRQTVSEHCPECSFTGEISPPPVFKEAHIGRGLKVHLYTFAGESARTKD